MNAVINKNEKYTLSKWTKFWLPPNISRPDMDPNGFMRPRAGYFNGELKTYKNLSDKNYLLFVGEPGMGKTNFCNQIEEKIAGLDNHLFLDFKTVKNLDTLKYFFVDKVKDKLKVNREVYVYLDGLDEGILQSPEIASTFCAVLNKEFKEFSIQLKLRITCRTSDLPKSIESDLKKFYKLNDDEINIYTLCPLTEDNVRDAASVNGIKANEFVEAIINKEVVPLAIRPVTLSFLIKLYKKSKSLPNDVTEIYEQGIELLCNEEHNEFRNLAKVDIKKLDVEERFLIAARIAYLLIFCNKSNLEKSDIKGFDEEWNNNEIQVNDKAIEEVLNTQVFTNSRDEISFSHKTYAEFLAAYYLVNNKVDIHALKNLFFNDLGKIHLNPALRQVAIWLSRYNNDFLDLVVQNDFEILFYQGNIQLDDKAKEKLIDAYIKTLVQGEIYNDWKHNFKVLNYKGLADKIIIEFEKTTHTGIIVFLIHLARFCDDKTKLQNIILDLALNHSNKHTQIEAVNYLADYGDEIAKEQLIEKLKKEDFKDDDHDEMRAALLKVVYNNMDYAEMLPYITNEKQPNSWKTYNPFLRYEFCEDLHENIDHLSKTLIHFSKNIEQKKDVIENIIGPGLVEAAIINISEGSVEKALVQFIGNRLVLNIPRYKFQTFLVHFEYNIKEEFERLLKRQFLEKLIYFLLLEKELEDFKIIKELTYQERIIGKEELNWVFENFENEQDEKLIACWWGFIEKFCCFGRYEPNKEHPTYKNLKILYKIYNSTSYKPFKSHFYNLFEGIDLKSETAQNLIKEYNSIKENEQRKKDNPRNKKQQRIEKINQIVCKEIEKIKSGEIYHWEYLINNKVHWPNVWNWIDEENQKEIIEAAKVYLANVENKCNCEQFSYGTECSQDNYIGGAFKILIHNEKAYLENQHESFFNLWVERMVANKTAKCSALLKLFYTKTKSKTNEAIKFNVKKLALLELKNEEENVNLQDFIEYVISLEGQEINEVLHSVILKNNKFSNELNKSTIYKVVNKLLKEEYEPFLENIRHWKKEHINGDYSTFGRVFSSTFSLLNNQDVLGSIVQKFMDDSDFEDYFIEENISTDELEHDKFCYKLNKLRKETCKQWLTHLDNRYPQKKNSILGENKIAELKKYLLDNIIQKSKDFKILDYYYTLKSKFKEKEDVNIINFKIIQAKESLSQRCWQPPTPEQLLYVAKRGKLPIETEKQLQELVMRKLPEIQKNLKENGTVLNRLWHLNAETPVHKSENEISNEIKELLMPLLNKIIVNREVQVFKGEKSGLGSADFQIDAFNKKGDQITVIVEAKGDFHDKVKTSMKTQLKENYLERNPSNHGIYLIYFTKKFKTNNISTYKKATTFFEDQAKELSDNNHNIKSFVLDITFAQEWSKN